jgi:hypothetical protein
MKNERFIGFRTTADIAGRIDALAEYEFLSVSDIVRRAMIQTVREFEAKTANLPEEATSMTDAEVLSAIVETANVPDEARMSYKAGYYEGALLSLMARFPEVRKEMGERARMAKWNREGV